MVLVFPDTSPRGSDIADDEAFSLGQGAGYYMTATDAPWAPHYAMDAYVTDELPQCVAQHVDVDWQRVGITGHSMGGHGALTLAMKNPGKYAALSAFAPISALSELPWGKIALDAYRGSDPASHSLYDAAAVMRSHGWAGDILVDQGQLIRFWKNICGLICWPPPPRMQGLICACGCMKAMIIPIGLFQVSWPIIFTGTPAGCASGKVGQDAGQLGLYRHRIGFGGLGTGLPFVGRWQNAGAGA